MFERSLHANDGILGCMGCRDSIGEPTMRLGKGDHGMH